MLPPHISTDIVAIDLDLAAEGARLVEELRVDSYGNPIDGSRLIYCCFPDCGCDGARLCMAENGASSCSMAINRERRKRWP